LARTPGVIAYGVDLKSDSAAVLYDAGKVTLVELKQAVANSGFRVHGITEVLN